KDPAARPRDAAELVELLDAAGRGALAAAPVARLGTAEHDILSVVMTGGAAFVESEALAATTMVTRLPRGVHGGALRSGTLAGAGGWGAAAQAAGAADVALALRAQDRSAAIAIATGPGLLALDFPVGGVIDTAAALLLAEEKREAPEILLDRATSGLLGNRFDLALRGDRFVLRGRRGPAAEPALAPFLGRAVELDALVRGLAAGPCRWLV